MWCAECSLILRGRKVTVWVRQEAAKHRDIKKTNSSKRQTFLKTDKMMSKVDNVHQSDQVAGTVLSKEFYANKPLRFTVQTNVEKTKMKIYSFIITITFIYSMVLQKIHSSYCGIQRRIINTLAQNLRGFWTWSTIPFKYLKQ